MKDTRTKERPVVTVEGGKTFEIMVAVIRALNKANRMYEVAEYKHRATSGDYDHMLQVTREYVELIIE